MEAYGFSSWPTPCLRLMEYAHIMLTSASIKMHDVHSNQCCILHVQMWSNLLQNVQHQWPGFLDAIQHPNSQAYVGNAGEDL